MTNIINNSQLQSEEAFDFLFKIVLIGDCGTGKTCVVQRFRSGTYIERQGSTIGVDFSMKTIFLDGKKIKVSITLTPYLKQVHKLRSESITFDELYIHLNMFYESYLLEKKVLPALCH